MSAAPIARRGFGGDRGYERHRFKVSYCLIFFICLVTFGLADFAFYKMQQEWVLDARK